MGEYFKPDFGTPPLILPTKILHTSDKYCRPKLAPLPTNFPTKFFHPTDQIFPPHRPIFSASPTNFSTPPTNFSTPPTNCHAKRLTKPFGKVTQNVDLFMDLCAREGQNHLDFIDKNKIWSFFSPRFGRAIGRAIGRALGKFGRFENLVRFGKLA